MMLTGSKEDEPVAGVALMKEEIVRKRRTMQVKLKLQHVFILTAGVFSVL